MRDIINALAEITSREAPCVIATVIRQKGSAPRGAGAKMLIDTEGHCTGTIGGGAFEAEVKNLAREVLTSKQAMVRSFSFSNEEAASMDALCGGEVDVLLEWINTADADWKDLLQNLLALYKQRQQGWLLTALPAQQTDGQPHPAEPRIRHAVVCAAQEQNPDLPMQLAADALATYLQPDLLNIEGQSWFVDPLVSGGTVTIFGAGHVGKSLASYTHSVDFWTVVVDDRPEYANISNVPSADELVVPENIESVFSAYPAFGESFIVIVTRGHMLDYSVLRQALRTSAPYIGMIGSRKKIKQIFDKLLEDGFTQADLDRVHAPIGLNIQAETPQEIGISIVAQLIQERARLSAF